MPDLALGGWANPHADASAQAGFIADRHFTGEFFLTQIVSHHDRAAIDRFQSALARAEVNIPGVFGIFYYRSANPRTLEALRQFLPVPVAELNREFAEGLSPEHVCARTIKALHAAGIRRWYISNLPAGRARQTMSTILKLVSTPDTTDELTMGTSR